jgi:hypothetical protein
MGDAEALAVAPDVTAIEHVFDEQCPFDAARSETESSIDANLVGELA